MDPTPSCTATVSRREALQRVLGLLRQGERERRWHVEDDIPWSKLNPDVSDEAALCAETFLLCRNVSARLRAGGLNMVRPYFGKLCVPGKLGLRGVEALVRADRIPAAHQEAHAGADVTGNVRPSRSVDGAVHTARQITIYGCFQEMATFYIYCRQREMARDARRTSAFPDLRLIGRDEIAHTRFYQGVTKVLLGEDRDGTLRDIAYVAKNFQHAGRDLIEDYESRIHVMRELGAIDRNSFLQKSLLPGAQAARRDPRRAREGHATE